MRNMFDQYSGPENRLTHALGCCLERDADLLREFVSWACGRNVPAKRLVIVEQQVPGTARQSGDEEERGLPDLWIYGDDGWCLLVESKVQARVEAEQLLRHRRTAERQDFRLIDGLLITPHPVRGTAAGFVCRTWSEVYAWFTVRRRQSSWADLFADYMEVYESRMFDEGYLEGALMTQFTGIPFSREHLYSYREAKRLLRIMMAELRQHPDLQKLGIDSDAPGRAAITGRDAEYVWDLLLLRRRDMRDFRKTPHFDLAFWRDELHVLMVIPDGVATDIRRALAEMAGKELRQVLHDVAHNVERASKGISGARPILQMLQRHYRSQRSVPTVDCELWFDLRTIAGSGRARVKRQDEWIEAAHQAWSNRKSNLQLAVGATLPYGEAHLNSRRILDVVARVWLGCRPLLKRIYAEQSGRGGRRQVRG